MMRTQRKRLFGVLSALLILWASSIYADETGGVKGPFQKGATEWSLSAGYGDNFHIGKDVKEDIQFYFLTPSWGKVLTEWDKSISLEFLVEGFLAYARQESSGRYAVGITPLLQLNFQPIRRTVLSLEAGVGVFYTDLNPKLFGSRFDFTAQGGIGVRYELARSTYLKFSYRFHHISNAGISEDNRGINSNLFSLGLSFYR